MWATTVTTMVKLVYAAIMSLDGYTADANGEFEWCAPDPDVLARINDLERDFGTYLYGRKMYETMVYWETFDDSEDQSPLDQDFADIWRAAAKVVYSTTLDGPSSTDTRIERVFDPAAVREMKATSKHDISVGGPNLAAQAIAAGLVDEMHLFLSPITVGAGTAALPAHFAANLELLSVERFESGVAHLHYRLSSRR